MHTPDLNALRAQARAKAPATPEQILSLAAQIAAKIGQLGPTQEMVNAIHSDPKNHPFWIVLATIFSAPREGDKFFKISVEGGSGGTYSDLATEMARVATAIGSTVHGHFNGHDWIARPGDTACTVCKEIDDKVRASRMRG